MQYSWFKIHIIKKSMLNHFLSKIILFLYFTKVLKLLHITVQAPYFPKNSNSNIFSHTQLTQ